MGPGTPHLRQMGLAAAGGTEDHQGRGRPVGPEVEPRHRRLVAGSDKEVILAHGRPVAEIQGKLCRRFRHGRHVSSEEASAVPA